MIKTTIIALVMVTGAFGFVNAEGLSTSKRIVKISPKSGKSIELTYLVEGKADVTVNIYNEQGEKVFSEAIVNKKSFTRGYDFGFMPEGQYKMEIVDAEGIVIKRISREIKYVESK